MVSTVVGRLAPSPTGVLHIGNARSLVAAWLSARAQGGQVLLRVEDLLPGQSEKVTTTLEDLAYIGLDWDAPPPDVSFRKASDFDVELPEYSGFWLQSARLMEHQVVSHSMIIAGMAYPCVCSRKDIETALRAPHPTTGKKAAGNAYPGTCRGRFTDLADALRWEGALSARIGRRPVGAALRLRATHQQVPFVDRFAGPQTVDVQASSGDFVIRRKDGLHAYMFAVVVDDIAMGVTEIVRGDDLLHCTGQQLLVANAVAEHADDELRRRAQTQRPTFVHLPLVYGDDGRRLAKRHQSIHVRNLEDSGVPANRLRRWITASLGLPPVDDFADAVAHFDWDRVPRAPIRFGAADLARIQAGGEYSPVIEKAENTVD